MKGCAGRRNLNNPKATEHFCFQGLTVQPQVALDCIGCPDNNSLISLPSYSSRNAILLSLRVNFDFSDSIPCNPHWPLVLPASTSQELTLQTFHYAQVDSFKKTDTQGEAGSFLS